MNPHVHISAVHLAAGLAATIAVFGTIHLLTYTSDNKLSRGWVALGF